MVNKTVKIVSFEVRHKEINSRVDFHQLCAPIKLAFSNWATLPFFTFWITR